MRTRSGRIRWLLALGLSFPFLAGTCAMDTRDAIIGGTMDFVSATTAEFLGQLVSQIFPPLEEEA